MADGLDLYNKLCTLFFCLSCHFVIYMLPTTTYIHTHNNTYAQQGLHQHHFYYILLHSSCAYSLSNSARHLRTSSGVKMDFSSGGDDDDENMFCSLPLQPPSTAFREAPTAVAVGSKPRTFLVFCGASGTTPAGTTHTLKLWSLQKRCRSCVMVLVA